MMILIKNMFQISNAASEVDDDTCTERERNDTATTLGTQSHLLS